MGLLSANLNIGLKNAYSMEMQGSAFILLLLDLCISLILSGTPFISAHFQLAFQ